MCDESVRKITRIIPYENSDTYSVPLDNGTYNLC